MTPIHESPASSPSTVERKTLLHAAFRSLLPSVTSGDEDDSALNSAPPSVVVTYLIILHKGLRRRRLGSGWMSVYLSALPFGDETAGERPGRAAITICELRHARYGPTRPGVQWGSYFYNLRIALNEQ